MQRLRSEAVYGRNHADRKLPAIARPSGADLDPTRRLQPRAASDLTSRMENERKQGEIVATRDDFSPTTKRTLAGRAGYACSNPDCRRLTAGAALGDDAKVVNVGGPDFSDKRNTAPGIGWPGRQACWSASAGTFRQYQLE